MMPDQNIETRRPTNVTLPEAMVKQAKDLKINISQACEAGLAAQVKAAREARWLEENRAAIDDYNKWIEEHGLPLEDYRIF
jgi:antitoxin CcdA